MNEVSLRAGAGCPWHEMREAYGYPTVKWCEESLCRLIEEPANTWSNLSYIIAGIYILLKARQSQSTPMVVLGLSAIFMGAASLVYHAMNNWPLQVLDFAGMYFYTSAIILFNLRRLDWVKANHSVHAYIVLLIINFLLIPLFKNVFGINIQLIIALNVLAMVALEFTLRRKDKSYPMKDFYFCLFTFGVAEVFSLIDLKRIWCDPSRHVIQGHAIWHTLGGLAVYYSYKYYRQFKRL